MRFRNLAAGLALLTTGTVVGVTTQQFASADVSSGDRPVLVPIESCRLADTREDPAFIVGPRTTPLGPAETYQIDSQEPGTECTGDIPTAASALAINLTALNASADGFITVWAQGDRPNGSTLNPQPGQLVFNAATVDLAADGSFLVYNERGTTDIIIDVIGYYENHDHDDRYYTQTQANDRYYTQAQVDAELDSVDAESLGGHPASAFPRLVAIIRMNSGIDGYAVEQGVDPGLTVTASSPSVMAIGTSGGATRSALESANCTAGFSEPTFTVYKSLDFVVGGINAELRFLQPDGTPLPFNGRSVFCTIWSRS